MFNGMFQFPDITGPGIIRKDPEHSAGNAFDIFIKASVELLAKVIDKQGNVTDALTQRRQGDLHNFETVVQILPEMILPDSLFKIAVGRGDDPNIHFY